LTWSRVKSSKKGIGGSLYSRVIRSRSLRRAEPRGISVSGPRSNGGKHLYSIIPYYLLYLWMLANTGKQGTGGERVRITQTPKALSNLIKHRTSTCRSFVTISSGLFRLIAIFDPPSTNYKGGPLKQGRPV
jgi:hypothetical protein